ncbi:hypothetical protein CR513_07490, partial [Mucuna pruriens]
MTSSLVNSASKDISVLKRRDRPKAKRLHHFIQEVSLEKGSIKLERSEQEKSKNLLSIKLSYALDDCLVKLSLQSKEKGKTILEVMKNEGHIVNIPPQFKGQNYDYWKQRIMTFFDACHKHVECCRKWKLHSIDKDRAEIPTPLWNEEQKKRKFIAVSCAKKYGTQLVTVLRASKDLKNLLMEELLSTLKVHEIELNKDKGQHNGMSIALEA